MLRGLKGLEPAELSQKETALMIIWLTNQFNFS